MLSFFSRIIIVIIVIIIVNIEVTGGTIKVQRRCIHYYGGTVVGCASARKGQEAWSNVRKMTPKVLGIR